MGSDITVLELCESVCSSSVTYHTSTCIVWRYGEMYTQSTFANLGVFGKSTENSHFSITSHGIAIEQYPFSLIKLKSYFSVN